MECETKVIKNEEVIQNYSVYEKQMLRITQWLEARG